MTYTVSPIGTVHNARSDPAWTDHWGDVVSTIVVDERFGDDCLVGLSDFSHVEVLFLFDQALERPEYRGLLRPRGRADLPEVGVFAHRGPRRPNRLGVTPCAIVSAVRRELQVRDLGRRRRYARPGPQTGDGRAAPDRRPPARMGWHPHARLLPTSALADPGLVRL